MSAAMNTRLHVTISHDVTCLVSSTRKEIHDSNMAGVVKMMVGRSKENTNTNNSWYKSKNEYLQEQKKHKREE